MTRRSEVRLVSGSPSLDDLPAVLTVSEAARVLRVSRGVAYELARQWRDSGGRQGLPCLVLGRSPRVPVEGLRRLLDVESPAVGQ